MIDTHAHLDHVQDLEDKLMAAYNASVKAIVTVSEDLATSQKNLEIFKKERTDAPKIYLAVGIHPSEARQEILDPFLDFVHKNRSELIAVGEIGLDFWYKWVKKDPVQKDIQKKIFRRLCALAKEFGLPISIHSRGAWDECLNIIKSEGIVQAVFHWYSGPVEVLKKIINYGYFVSTTPAIAYSPQSQEAMRLAPIEQTMLETDSPVFYCNKESEDPGFRAEPKDVWRTLKAYAALKGISEEEASEKTTLNAEKFFNLKGLN